MTARSLGVGIIGTSGIALAKHLPNLAKCPEVGIEALCDVDATKAEEAAAKYGVEGARVYTDYKQLLEDTKVDVVHICTPNNLHAPMTVAALEAGKHVMCEKPMARTYAEAKLMLDAAERTGKKLTIGYQNRFRTDTRYLKQICDAGELGEIYYAKALALRRRGVPTWGVFLDQERQGGGPLIDIGTHALDLTLWFMNNYAWESVTGSVFKKLRERKNAANPFGPWDPEKFTAEDSAFGFIRFENGATVLLESSWALNTLEVGEAQCKLCGTEAGADFDDGLRINGEKYGRLFVTKPDLTQSGVDFYEGNAEDSAAYLEIRSWIDCLVNDTDPVVKAAEAAVVTQLLEAIYRSAAENRTIYNATVEATKIVPA